MKLALKFLGLLLLVTIGVQFVRSGSAYAAISPGYFTGRNDSDGYGDTVLPSNVWDSNYNEYVAIPSSVNSVNELENFIENKYHNGTKQEKVGAAYIIQTMRQIGPGATPMSNGVPQLSNGDIQDWESRISNLVNNDGGTIKWNETYSYTKNTMDMNNGDGDPYDVAQYDDCTSQNPCSEAHTIEFINSNGRVIYAIKHRCANPVGPGAGLSEVPKGSVNAKRCQDSIYVNGVDNGFNNSPASYVKLTSNNGNTPNRFPASGYRYLNSYTISVPDWVKNRTTNESVGVELWVKDSAGNDIKVDTATISEPWQPCGTKSQICTYFSVKDPGLTGGGGKHTHTKVTITGTTRDGTYWVGWGQTVSSKQFAGGTYQAISPTIHIQVDTYYVGASNPSYPNQIPTGSYNCYHARCNIVSVSTNVPPTDTVQVNNQFTVGVTVTNDNTDPNRETIPASVGGYNFSLTEPPENGRSGFTENDVGTSLDVGDTSPPVYISFTAPSSIQNYTVSFYPDYYGHGSLGTGCSTTVPIYQYFHIKPSAGTPTGNTENPTTITYTTSGADQGPAGPVNSSSSSWLTLQSTGATVDGAHPGSHSYGTASDGPFTYNPLAINAGDTYCSHININPATGYLGPGGAIAHPASETADSGSCLTVVNEPYVHFLGGDVDAGGGFGNNCTVNQGFIDAYTNDNSATQPRGSGSQFGAQALGVIEGFNSAILRNSSPTSPMGLTFANTNASGSPPGATMGGSLGLSSYCVPDYYGAMPAGATNYASNTMTGSIPSGARKHTGDLTIKNITSNMSDTTANAIYVDGGNVYIKSDIKYGNTAWNAKHVSDVPSFYLIVRGGNIYIDPGVKQLDGIYVAQPNGGSGGFINTCSTGAGTFKVNQLYPSSGDGCKNQLVVNGAFVAQRLYLDRSYSSLRYSVNGENPQGVSHNCGTAGGDVPGAGPTSLADCAAEIFNFSPEIYLTQPAMKPSSGPTTGRFDYITSLSPVL